jgi:gliding motility-associated-like protein
MINNFSGVADGFSIDFAGSTAAFKSPDAPVFSFTGSVCGVPEPLMSITLHLDQPVLCSSIAPDGSDFIFSKSTEATIVSAEGVNCNGNTGYTQDVFLTYSNEIPADLYDIRPNKGSDGNTVLGICGSEQPVTDNVKFFYWPEIIANAGPDTAVCFGSKVTLHGSVTGGYLNRLKWEPSTYLNDINLTDPAANPVKDTFFVFTITDAALFCTYRDTVYVKVLRKPDLKNTDTVICGGGTVPLRVTGDSRFKYTWTPDTYLTPTTRPPETTTYTLQAYYPGCTQQLRPVKVDVEPLPQVNLGNDTSVCYGAPLYIDPVISDDWYTGYNYTWTPSAAFDDPGSMNPAFTASTSSDIALKVTTPHGCTGTDQRKISVSMVSGVDAGEDVMIVAGSTVTLHGMVEDLQASFAWSPFTSLSGNRILEPVASPVKTQLYYLSAKTGDNCISKDSVLITVLKAFQIPNAFTPNGDGVNDRWNIPGLSGYEQAWVEVYNRWGQIVFKSSGYRSPWDGTTNGRKLPSGAYYYIVKTGMKEYATMSGVVMIIR